MSTEPPFRPVTLSGSCHCGHIKYLVTMQLPGPSSPPKYSTSAEAHAAASGQRSYKCNCTTCHKLGIFHLRPVNPHTDFYVLAPLDSLDCDGLGSGVSKYLCFDKHIGWYFCANCGARPFLAAGEFEVVEKEIDVPVPGPVDGEYKTQKEKRKVWQVKDQDRERTYLSVNMVTIDQIQPGGFDLRKWQEKGCIEYLDWLTNSQQKSDKPWPGGMY